MARTFTLQPVARQFVPLSRISPNLVSAVIAAEDGKFCSHYGVDWESLYQVVESAADGDESRGASTISMQLTKNLFLWHGQSYLRKAVEIPLSIALDTVWGKRRVMQSYLNVAEFGRGVFGAEAAARRYFGKSAARLTPREAALLAATLPSPKKRNPARPSAYVSSYATLIQSRMGQVDRSCARGR
jgi:monofunctional biosynthetic peptidoglycan transglycosylase